MSKISTEALRLLHCLQNDFRRRERLMLDIQQAKSELLRDHDLDVEDHVADTTVEMQRIRSVRDWNADCLKRAEASIAELQQQVREADTLRWQLEERIRNLEAQLTPLELTESEKELIRSGHLIPAIKELRTRTNCGLRRAKDSCDAWRAANK